MRRLRSSAILFPLCFLVVEFTLSQPANDYFANRIHLVGAETAVSGTTAGAAGTMEPGEPAFDRYGSRIVQTVWYTWTAPAAGVLSLIGEPVAANCFHMAVLAYRGDSLGLLAPLVPDAVGKYSVTTGDVIQIQVGSSFYWSSPPCAGPFGLRVLLAPPPPAGLIEDQVQTTSDTAVRMYGMFGVSFGQTFTPAISGQLYALRLAFTFGYGDVQSPVSVDVVETVNGLPSSRVLGRAVVRRLTDYMQEFSFFDQGVYLKAETQYAFVIATSTFSAYSFSLSTGDGYKRGALFQKSGSTAWEPAHLHEQPNEFLDLVFSESIIPGLPPVVIDAPKTRSSWRIGDAIALTAVLNAQMEPPVTVEFYSGTDRLGVASQSPFALSWSPTQAGTVDIRATASDQRGMVYSSPSIALFVKAPGPGNDDFRSRTFFPGDYSIQTFTTERATLEVNEPRPFAHAVGESVWWSWTAPRDGFTSVDVLEPSRPAAVLGVFTGNALDVLETVSTEVGHCSFLAASGQEYAICVDGLSTSLAEATLVVAQSDLEIASPVFGAEFTVPASFPITTSRVGESRALSRIEFYANETPLGVRIAAPYQINGQIYVPGYYQLRLRAYDQLGVPTEAVPVPITIHPANDDFENAIVVTGNGISIQTSTLGATVQHERFASHWVGTGEPTYADNQGGHSIWYKWTAPEDGFCTVGGTGNGFSLLLGVYVGNTVSALSLIAGNALNPNPVSFYAHAGSTYYISVDGGFGEEGDVSWNLSLRPRNDDFGMRILIDGSTYEIIASERGATLETQETQSPSGAASSVWWFWKAPISSRVVLSTVSSAAATQIAVFQGSKIAELIKLASTPAWQISQTLAFDAVEGETYQIAVYGRSGQSADFTFSLATRGIRLLNPLDGTVLAAPASLQLRVQIDTPDSSIVGVEYYANGSLLGRVDQPPYDLTWTDVAPATYRLAARTVVVQGSSKSTPSVTVLVSQNNAADTPRIFAGHLANCSYILNALGELRISGIAGNQFGLTIPDNLIYPTLAQRPAGVDKWIWIGLSDTGFYGVPYSAPFGSDYFASWALTGAGELYRFGWQKVPFPTGVDRWVDAVAGSGVALVVGNDGQVYKDGQQPIGFAVQGVPWRSIALSGTVVATISREGALFLHGLGNYGQAVSALIPIPPSVSRWLRIGASFREIILQGENHELYVVPGNIGVGTGGQWTPSLVERPDGVVAWTDFSAGGYHVLALGDNGQIYTWGRNWEGQLGIGSAGADVNTPTLVPAPPGVTRWTAIASGYEHSLAVGNDCSLYAWGDNRYGQLGQGLTLNQNLPVRVSNLRALCGAPIVFAEGEAVPLEDGSIRVQFKSDMNRSYLLQYTEDLLEWKTAFPPLTGTGGTLEWIDDGPPKTESHPTSQLRRLYRLVYAP